MFIKKETVEKVEFFDVSGYKIGCCSLTVRSSVYGMQSAVYDAKFRNGIQEHTTFRSLEEARQVFECDLQHYTDKYRDV